MRWVAAVEPGHCKSSSPSPRHWSSSLSMRRPHCRHVSRHCQIRPCCCRNHRLASCCRWTCRLASGCHRIRPPRTWPPPDPPSARLAAVRSAASRVTTALSSLVAAKTTASRVAAGGSALRAPRHSRTPRLTCSRHQTSPPSGPLPLEPPLAKLVV